MQPHCNALLKEGSKSDRIDGRRLAQLLRANLLRPVYHGEHGVRKSKELARSYVAIGQVTRTGHGPPEVWVSLLSDSPCR
jgi:hypothetical protein